MVSPSLWSIAMSRNTVRWSVLVVALLGVAVVPGAVSATEHEANSAKTAAEASTNVHVNTHADEEGLVVTVGYEGDASALVTVQGTDASYRDGGQFEVANERTFRLDTPERPSGIEVIVETDDSEFVRTVEYETVRAKCGNATHEARLPTHVEYEWSITAGNTTRSDSRAYDIPVPTFHCPELPVEGDMPNGSQLNRSALFSEVNESFTDHGATISEQIEEAHDKAHDAEDDGHETVRDGVRDVNESAHDSYDESTGVIDSLLQGILNGNPFGDARNGADHAADDASESRNDTERDAAVAGEAAGSMADKAEDDGQRYAERAGDEVPGQPDDDERSDQPDHDEDDSDEATVRGSGSTTASGSGDASNDDSGTDANGSARVDAEIGGEVSVGDSEATASGSATVAADGSASAS